MGSDALGLLNAWDIRQSTGPHPHPALCAHLICLPEKHLCSSAQRNCTRGICQKHPFRDYLFLDDPNVGWVFWGVGGGTYTQKIRSWYIQFFTLLFTIYLHHKHKSGREWHLHLSARVFFVSLWVFSWSYRALHMNCEGMETRYVVTNTEL